jgi:predicted lipoprotein with Yx(FWY)xxD motif
MRAKIILAATVALSLAFSGVVYAASMPTGVKTQKVADGKTTVLTDAKGMTLYTFDMDKDAGKSACNGQCAMYWPPLAAGADAKAMGDWTVISRDDGAKQWAWKGKPLYTFMKDMKPGDTTGDGMGQNGAHVWHCAVVS